MMSKIFITIFKYKKYLKLDIITFISIVIWLSLLWKLDEVNNVSSFKDCYFVLLVFSIIFFQSFELWLKDYLYSKGMMNSIVVWNHYIKNLKPKNKKYKYSAFRLTEYSMSIMLFYLSFCAFVLLAGATQIVPNHFVIIRILSILTILFFVNSINGFFIAIFRIIESEEHYLKKFQICFDENGIPKKCFEDQYFKQHVDIVAIEQDYVTYGIIDLNRELKYLNSLKVKSSISFFNNYFIGSMGALLGIIISKLDYQSIKEILHLPSKTNIIILWIFIFVLVITPNISKFIKQLLFIYTEEELYLRTEIVNDLIEKLIKEKLLKELN